MMTKASVVLIAALLVAPGDVSGAESAPREPFGCIKPEIFYDALSQADGAGKTLPPARFAKACRGLAGLPYLRVGDRDGLAEIRVFPKPGDWATSVIIYTLDEMLAPEEPLDGPAASR
jgi:hypothetical protein